MIKTLAKSIREYKKPSMLAPLFVTLEVIFECIMPFLIANLVTAIERGAQISEILRSGLLILAMAFLSLLFGAFSGNFAATGATGFAKNLRKDMFSKIQGFAFGIGIERVAILKNGIDDIRNFYTNDIRFLEEFKEVK